MQRKGGTQPRAHECPPAARPSHRATAWRQASPRVHSPRAYPPRAHRPPRNPRNATPNSPTVDNSTHHRQNQTVYGTRAGPQLCMKTTARVLPCRIAGAIVRNVYGIIATSRHFTFYIRNRYRFGYSHQHASVGLPYQLALT